MKITDKKFHARQCFMGALGIVILLASGFGSYRIWRQYRLDHAALPAFPGVEGFGAATEGGRFGRIVFVTHLQDTTDANSPDYPGSLRWAVDHTWKVEPGNPFSGRRIVIFRVGGTINLVDKLILRNPNITIAGQTAPGDGILLKGDEFTIATHDVIVRGMRVRVGGQGTPTCCRDGINIGTFFATSDVYNVIVDHSSISWAVDENFSVWSDPADGYTVHDITIQWNVISQGLYNSIHVDEGAADGMTDPHSMGLIVGSRGKNITIHHNLFALNWGRNPRVDGVDGVEVLNNVIYGWVNEAVEFGGTAAKTHIIGNYFKSFDSSSADEFVVAKPLASQGLIYPFDNFVDDPRPVPATTNMHISAPENFLLADKIVFQESGVVVEPPQAAYQAVLDSAGATAPARDPIDRRIMEDVINRTGSIIDSQDEMGGWPVLTGAPYPQDTDGDGIPDEWEAAHGSDPHDPYDASSYKLRAPSGYTWIEEYINSLMLRTLIPNPSPFGMGPG